jgi:hypothetical protein
VSERFDAIVIGAGPAGEVAASRLPKYAALAIKTGTALEVLRDTVAQFPTFSEAFLKGLRPSTRDSGRLPVRPYEGLRGRRLRDGVGAGEVAAILPRHDAEVVRTSTAYPSLRRVRRLRDEEVGAWASIPAG